MSLAPLQQKHAETETCWCLVWLHFIGLLDAYPQLPHLAICMPFSVMFTTTARVYIPNTQHLTQAEILSSSHGTKVEFFTEKFKTMWSLDLRTGKSAFVPQDLGSAVLVVEMPVSLFSSIETFFLDLLVLFGGARRKKWWEPRRFQDMPAARSL